MFQPHRYSRVKQFNEEFAEELSKADVIYVTSIYGAGERNEDKITSKIITDLIYKKNKNVIYINNYYEVAKNFYELTQKGDLILIMGAGDCHNFWSILNEKKIKVNQNIDLYSSKYGISSSEMKKLKKYECFNQDNTIKMGSIAYKIALVAKGTMDIAISFTKKNDWDIAAADLILKEAGGYLKNISGNKMIYNSSQMQVDSVLASNSILIEKLCTELNECKK